MRFFPKLRYGCFPTGDGEGQDVGELRRHVVAFLTAAAKASTDFRAMLIDISNDEGEFDEV